MIAVDGRLANWVTERANALGNLRPSWSKQYTGFKLSYNSELQNTLWHNCIGVIWLFLPASWQLIALHSAFYGYNTEKLLRATEEDVFQKVSKLVYRHATAQISWWNSPWAHWSTSFTRNRSSFPEQCSKEWINEQYTWECVLAAENELLQSQAVILTGEAWRMWTMLCTTKLLSFCYFIYCMSINNLCHFLFFPQLSVLSQ